MHADSRGHVSVGIDGRQYVRKSAMYIDVLGMPTIIEAVHAASEMMRRGIERAMASNIEDDSSAAIRPEKSERPHTQAPQAQAAAPARPDAASVYSAVTKRVRKPPPDNADSSKNGQSNAPEHTDEESAKDVVSQPEATGGVWNSAKKAGPSILSKRSRPQSTSSGSAPERILQPSQKRERRADGLGSRLPSSTPGTSTPFSRKASDAKAASSTGASSQRSTVVVSEREGEKGSKGTLQLQPKPSMKDDLTTKREKLGSIQQGSSLKKDLSRSDMPEQQKTVKGSSPKLTSSGLSTNEAGPQQSCLTSAEHPSATSSDVRTSASSQNESAVALPKGLGLNVLPPAWSQVGANGSKDTIVRPAPTSKNSVIQKPVTSSSFGKGAPAKATISLAPTKRRGELSGGLSLQQVAAKRASQTPPTGSQQMKISPAEALIPSPSGVSVLHVPGSEIINGVRPNGYTVTAAGVVKPLVTFNPKPKLPHKLRQASLDRLFELWRDAQKLPESEALSNALRTEQEIYANASGRVDYRAAVMGKIKHLRT